MLASVSEPRTRKDRKSTRLNSSHLVISYAVFCLKKKKRSQRCITPSPLQITPRSTTPNPSYFTMQSPYSNPDTCHCYVTRLLPSTYPLSYSSISTKYYVGGHR